MGAKWLRRPTLRMTLVRVLAVFLLAQLGSNVVAIEGGGSYKLGLVFYPRPSACAAQSDLDPPCLP